MLLRLQSETEDALANQSQHKCKRSGLNDCMPSVSILNNRSKLDGVL